MQPEIRIERTVAGTVVEFVSLLLNVVLIALVAIYWSRLPESVPTHFDLDGTPNGYGSKSVLFLLIGISAFTSFIMLWGAYHPRYVLTKRHEIRNLRQHHYGMLLLRIYSILLPILFISVVLNVFYPAQYPVISFMPMVLVIMVVAVGVYCSVRISRCKE